MKSEDFLVYLVCLVVWFVRFLRPIAKNAPTPQARQAWDQLGSCRPCDAPELRKFVQAKFPKDPTCVRNPGIALHREETSMMMAINTNIGEITTREIVGTRISIVRLTT